MRVIVVDNVGYPTLDSGSSQNAEFPRINPSDAFKRSEGNIRVFRDQGTQLWFYQIRPINDTYFLISAIPRPHIQIRTIFQDELLNPLFRVGLIGCISTNTTNIKPMTKNQTKRSSDIEKRSLYI